ncbi:DUF86 domain-containing protein [Curvibacter sp. APW13]|uniref:HepT-like ribonuclease domain-containing protein n=1 Tax=Curvibacter sp. APW13 TaxID=3077236 RepID=UPI0028E06E97|nr:DUF86 domain-containing protein [Curvibacter sp. APW13]MDT8992942.1 DUF86 domain-containing protein [Curvibacter sp. APW13]
MTRDAQRLVDYLGHILEAIERIEHYVADMDEMGFLGNKLVQDAVIRNFEILGEASNNIEKRFPEFVAAHPELPLASAYQMRNALAHGYFKVDFEILWKTIHRELPGLHAQIREARAALDGAGAP